MSNFFAYVRVSTARQGEHGVSLQEQRDSIERYAKSQQLKITEWFEERITAAKIGRPVFSRMLSGLRKGGADGVIIHKIDRSARNLRDWAYLGELLDMGMDVRFAYEGLDLHSRGGRLSADIQAVVASDFVRNLRDETRKGIYGRLKQGLLPRAAPIGYRDNGGGRVKTICPLSGPLVREAFQLYSTGEHTLHTLADTMHDRALRTRCGGRIHRSAWAEILRNPFYSGVIRVKKTGECFPGTHEPLVAQVVFDRVQAVLDGRQPKRGRIHDHLFRQLFKCSRCGNLLIGEHQKGHVYYRCHTRSCRLSCIREDVLETAVIEALSPLQFSSEEVKELERVKESLNGDKEDVQRKLLDSLRLQVEAVKAKLDRLTDAYIDRLLDKDAYESRRQSLLQEQQRLQDRTRHLESGKQLKADTAARILELAKTVCSAYEMGILVEKRDLLKNVFSNRAVNGKNVELSMRIPYSVLSKRPSVHSGSPARDTNRTWRAWLAEVTRLFLEDSSLNE